MNTGDIVEKHFKFLSLLLGLVILGCLAVIGTTLIMRNTVNDAYVSITVAPYSAKVLLNDEEYSVGSHIIKSGKYNVKIEAPGFTTKEFSFEAKGGQVASIATYLVHREEGMNYYERSAEDINILKNLSADDNDLKAFLDAFQKKKDIIYVLPIDASYEGHKVTIKDGSARSDCEKAICLLAEGFVIDKDRVNAAIADKGFTASDYSIIYDYLKEDK